MDLENDDEVTDPEYVPEKDAIHDDSDGDPKEASVTSISRSVNKNNVWSYYKIHDGDSGKATCVICKADVRFSSVSNLLFHVIEHHGQEDSRNYVDEASSDEEEREKKPRRGYKPVFPKRRRSKGWKYFDIIDPGSRLAKCKICSKPFSYMTSVSNLMKHVRTAHKMAHISSDDEEKVAKPEPVTRKEQSHVPTKKPRSECWKYFDVLDPQAKIAKCKICKRGFSYIHITNLRKHLRRKHRDLGTSDEETDVEDIEENAAVWAYFRCLDQRLKIASCLICKRRIDYKDDNDLAKHLSRKHPRVDLEGIKTKPKKLMITENGDIYEIDDDVAKEEPAERQDSDNNNDDWSFNNDEVDALNTEYLEEHLSDEPEEYKPHKKKLKISPMTPQAQTTQPETSLDMFAKYMVSLLQKLPKHKSDQLQVEIIKKVMDAQLSSDKKRSYRSKPHRIEYTRYPSQSMRNTRYSTQSVNNDDTRVTSNSEAQRNARDAENVEVSNVQIVTSVGEQLTE